MAFELSFLTEDYDEGKSILIIDIHLKQLITHE